MECSEQTWQEGRPCSSDLEWGSEWKMWIFRENVRVLQKVCREMKSTINTSWRNKILNWFMFFALPGSWGSKCKNLKLRWCIECVLTTKENPKRKVSEMGCVERWVQEDNAAGVPDQDGEFKHLLREPAAELEGSEKECGWLAQNWLYLMAEITPERKRVDHWVAWRIGGWRCFCKQKWQDLSGE